MNGTATHDKRVAQEALGILSPDDVDERLFRRWTPTLYTRFRVVIRGLVDGFRQEARQADVVTLSKLLLQATPETMHQLAVDPDFGRWVESIERILAQEVSPKRLPGLLALLPRFVIAASIKDGLDLDLKVRMGAGGRARVPADGRVLQGPPGHQLRVVVESGTLMNHTRAPRKVGIFEIVDGDASGGAIPRVDPLSGGAVFECYRTLQKSVKVLEHTSPEMLAEAGALSPVLIPIRTDSPEVSHSAGLQSVRGGIWLSFPPNPLVVAETIVHEASHVLFHLLEDAEPTVEEPDAKRFTVPWRTDPRPLRAVLMGYHAWVRIFHFLSKVSEPTWQQPAQERMAIIKEALHQAQPILAKAHGYTEMGRAVWELLAERHEGYHSLS
jgi:hypothetical protein